MKIIEMLDMGDSYRYSPDVHKAFEMLPGVHDAYGQVLSQTDRDTAIVFLATMAFKAVDVADGTAEMGDKFYVEVDGLLFVKELITDHVYDPDAPERTKRAGVIADLWMEAIEAQP